MKKTTLTLVTTLLALSATLVACGQQTTTNSNHFFQAEAGIRDHLT